MWGFGSNGRGCLKRSLTWVLWTGLAGCASLTDCHPTVGLDLPDGLDPGDAATLERAMQKGDALPYVFGAKCKF